MSEIIVTTETKIAEMLKQNTPLIVAALMEAIKGIDPAPAARYSQRQIAKRWNITEPTLIKWRRDGLIEYEQINGRVYYTDDFVTKAFEAMGKKPELKTQKS